MSESTPKILKPNRPPLRLVWMEAGKLTGHALNYKTHPPEQLQALDAVIHGDRIGWAGALLLNEVSGKVLDGRGRLEAVAPTELVPVLIGQWDEADEATLIASLDPLGGLARASQAQLDELLGHVDVDALGAASDAVLAQLEAATRATAAALEQATAPQPPPAPPDAGDGSQERPKRPQAIRFTEDEWAAVAEFFDWWVQNRAGDGPKPLPAQITLLVFADYRDRRF